MIKLKQSGFSLLEVMIAVVSFAAFMAAFSLSQGSGLNDSARMKEEITLHTLAESKLNEIIINPPKFSKGLTLSADTKTFEEEAYENYEYKIEYAELELPDLEKLVSAGSGQEEEESQESREEEGIKRKVFKKLKKNLERIIWQVTVTVKNKTTGEEYPLSSWVENRKAKIQVGL